MATTPFPNAPGAARSGAAMVSRLAPGAKKKRRKKAKKRNKPPVKPAQPSNVDMALNAIRGAGTK